jgi:heme/copper-type cytochrome/quinol oxidase subunit 4/mono/diheme cytochrome c family protein
MSSNPGQEAAMAHDEHAAHEDAGISRFFFGHVPEGVHGGLKQYGLLAIFLGIITLIEFLIIVPQGFRGTSIVIAPLVILSVIKFFCVVAFFMHLKFENRLLWQIFVAGLVLGLIVALSLVLLFGVFRLQPRIFSDGRQAPFEHHVEEAEPIKILVAPTAVPLGAVTAPAPSGGAAGVSPGQQLFTGRGGCSACHTIEDVSAGILGPDLSRIATVAESRIPGYSAEQYIRESVNEPDAYTVSAADDGIDQDFQEGLMVATTSALGLTGEDVNQLVEYLMTLR